MRYRHFIAVSVAALAISISHVGCAQEAAEGNYDVAAQELKYSLRDLARQAGLELVAPSEALAGKMAPAVRGHYSLQQAVDALLAGSDLRAIIRDGAIIIRQRTDSLTEAADSGLGSSDIVVTGSRIRGATQPSPVITLSQMDMRLQGQNNLGEAIRSLPQNFTGGQNPGVGVGNFGSTTGNFNGTSSLNLRGLGPDASLTLLNGHRLSYDGAIQSVDISAVPMGAVERIEVVADGASAIYGSDAVGGVANIIIKRDYQGLEGTVRFGASTDGGNAQQQYTIVGGRRWDSGGFILTYNYEHATPILARHRAYGSSLYRDADLVRGQSAHNLFLGGHQMLTTGLEFNLDALYSRRSTGGSVPYATDHDVFFSGQIDRTTAKSLSIAPSLKAAIGSNWNASLSATYAKSQTQALSNYYDAGNIFFVYAGCNCNELASAELNAEGKLFELPGGPARLAIGGGYRWIGYHLTAGGLDYRASRDSYFGYGELFLPVAERLSVTAALRYENYPGMANVATPKLGLTYRATDDISIKGSWGRSFKAPTLVQENFPRRVYVYPASAIGAVGFPAAATVLYREGGSDTLKPERARSWSGTVILHPQAVSGLNIEVSYFNIRYRDRVVQPIASLGGVLTNPIYQSLITFAPSRQGIDAAIAGADDGLSNPFNVAYDPNNVVALIDNLNRNIASQRIEGIDVFATYRRELQNEQVLTVSANGSYLKSTQKLSSAEPTAPLAGTIFNPPHYRGRAGASWESPSVTLSTFFSYIGGVRDTRTQAARHVGAMTSLDLTAVVHLGSERGFLSGVDVSLSLLNALNDKPSIIQTGTPFYTPYDSTNYSSIGRFISLTISKRI